MNPIIRLNQDHVLASDVLYIVEWKAPHSSDMRTSLYSASCGDERFNRVDPFDQLLAQLRNAGVPMCVIDRSPGDWNPTTRRAVNLAAIRCIPHVDSWQESGYVVLSSGNPKRDRLEVHHTVCATLLAAWKRHHGMEIG